MFKTTGLEPQANDNKTNHKRLQAHTAQPQAKSETSNGTHSI